MGEAKRRKALDPTYGRKKDQIVRFELEGISQEILDKRFESPVFFDQHTISGHTIHLELRGDDLFHRGRSMTLRGCINALKSLPEGVCRHYNFVPTTPDERFMMQWFKNEYTAIVQWLEYLMLGERGIDDFFTKMVTVKPRADLSKAVFDLAAELLPRCPELQQQFSTPLEVWWDWERTVCFQMLWGNGVLTGIPDPQAIFSKRFRSEAVNASASRLEALDNRSGILKLGKPVLEKYDSILEGWSDILVSVASEHKDFRRCKAMLSYKKTLRAWGRIVRSPHHQFPLIKDGRFVTNSLQKNQ